ncbi:hypothetical protein [Hymenobacter chitinivorans]|uniref:Lipoprotein n=1 Tax=Hymenobacter chitinivorans DSM 11115 TaxID=1121954 RepID=A0A2M9BMR1_9BACT|nr:hypothetical protein [Hymenobacter chitinivorans]PJJ59238.1 hypothetical protein CLV45_0654 [Hymenobacter chitinivorans DSM 11115]
MKICFFLLPAVTLLAGCNNSPEKRAESAVSEYVGNRMGDPASYRAGTFDTKPYTRQDSATYAAQVAQLNADSAATPATAPKLANGTAQIGTFVRHDYREQTKVGDVSRDSGEFVVYPNGDVVQLIPSHRLKRR